MKAKRILAAVGVVVAAGVVPLVTATEASATPSACVNYIGSHGYRVGPKVKAACNNAPYFHGIPNPACVVPLVQLRVNPDYATTACKMA